MAHISKLEMTEEEWKARRNTTIGASDIGVILGFSKRNDGTYYKTPRYLLGQKLGLNPPTEETDIMRWGTLAEDFCQALFEREHPDAKVQRDNKIRFAADYPWATCNLDRAIVGGPDGPVALEFKTTVGFVVKSWTQPIPLPYFAQAQWQMFVTGWKKAVIYVVVLDERRTIELNIDRNEEFIHEMLKTAEVFMEALNSKNPEALPMELEDIELITPVEGTKIEATDEIAEQLTIAKNASNAKSDAEKIEKAAKAKIKEFIGENENLVEKDTDRVLATYKIVSKDGFTVAPSKTRQLQLTREKKEKKS